MIFVFSKREELKTILSNEDNDMCPYFDDLFYETLDSTMVYDFSVPKDHPKAELLENEGYVVRKDDDGEYIQFKIKEVNDDKISNIRAIKTENVALEMLTRFVSPATTSLLTPSAIMDYILNGSRWERGICGLTESRVWTFDDYKNKIEALQLVKSQYDTDIRFRVEIQGQKIVNRYVDMATRGTKTGKRFDYTRDIKGLRRIRNTNSLCTAVIARGTKDDGTTFTLADVEWKVIDGDPVNKPLGQDWVGDEEALQKWGDNDGEHKYFYLDSNESKTPDALIDEAWKHLQKHKDPIPVYEIDAIMIDELFGTTKVRIGDTISAFDMTFNPPILIEARVFEMEKSFTDPTQNKIVLGDYKELTVRTAKQIKELQDKLKVQKTVVNNKVSETVYLQDISNPTTGLIVRVENAEGTITTHGQEIGQKVNLDEVITAVNNSTETVKIQPENLFLDYYITATHISSLNGLNVNNQFIVDASGNVSFKGNLTGASGTFSGTLSTSSLSGKVNISGDTIKSSDIVGSTAAEITDGELYLYSGGLSWETATDKVQMHKNGLYFLHSLQDTYYTYDSIFSDSAFDIDVVSKKYTFGSDGRMTVPDEVYTPIVITKEIKSRDNTNSILTVANGIIRYNYNGEQYWYSDKSNGWTRFKIGDVFLKSNGTNVLEFKNNSDSGMATVKALAFETVSDRAMKTNIEDLNISAIDSIKPLMIKEYNFIGEKLGAKKSIGLIAQDTTSLISSGSSIDLYAMSSLTIKGLQEVITRLEAVENKLGM